MAFWAASTPASSVKWSSRVPVEAPEPLAAHVSTIAVANAVISDVPSVWARGIVVEAVRFGRLGLLHAVAGDVRGVVEPGQHGRVRGHEHLGLADVALTRNECQRFLARPGQLVDRPHRLLSARAALSGSAPRQDS